MEISAQFRRTLLEERDKARRDPRLKARFCSYRLNVPSQDESSTLLTVDDWQAVLKRPVPDANGKPVVGIDLGGGRSWSAACGLWRSGRVEAVAVAPGIPSLADQERRDRVPSGTYQRLRDSGALYVADGLRVPKPKQLVSLIASKWGKPAVLVCDRFRLGELKDAANGYPVSPRISRWSESSFDIRALRKQAADGDLSVEARSRGLLSESLAVSVVKSDDSGNFRMVKDSDHCSRDDVAAALVLAAGAAERAPKRGRKVYHGKI